MKNKKGISLIVLVITIIVMIILASAVVISVSNTGIIGKANTAVNKTEKQTVEQLISIAWGEAYAEGNRTVEGIKKAMAEKLQGVDLSNYEYEVTLNGVEVTVLPGSNNGNMAELESNDYGFFYNVAYEWPVYVTGYGPGSFVFHEDGSAEVYMALGNITGGADTCNYSYEAGTVTYENGKITLPNTYFATTTLVVKDNGLTLVAGDDSFECTAKIPGSVKLNQVYVGVDAETNKPVRAIFKNSNTLEITYYTDVLAEEATTVELSVYFEGNNHIIKVNGDSYAGAVDYSDEIGIYDQWGWQEDAFAHVSFDGKQIMISGSDSVSINTLVTLTPATVNN